MVRDEADLIRTNILYHLSLGFDRVLVVDNGSTDGTIRELERLSRDPRVEWSSYGGEFDPGKILTRLARQAHREGADWVAQLDADDFWHATRDDFKKVLERSRTPALRVKVRDFVQRREQEKTRPEALLHMTRRADEPFARDGSHEELLVSREISYIELERVPKVIHRTSAGVQLFKGGHRVGGLGGAVEDTDEIVILHAPLRSREKLEEKATFADRRVLEGSTTSGAGWHTRRWRRAQEEGDLVREWAANSYASGCLDVYGAQHQLAFDTTLRDAIFPFVKRPFWKRIVGRR